METARKRVVVRKKPAGAYHHGDLKTALKRAALRLVRDRGPRAFSLNEASRLAGVSAGAPYRHFHDKDALLAELACDGLDLMIRDLQTAAHAPGPVREQMLDVGLAYIQFAATNADYFAVIFQAGLDKASFPELAHKAREAFEIINGLAHRYEPTPELARQRAVLSWSLAHGMAALIAEGALETAMPGELDTAQLRRPLEQFLQQPFSSEKKVAAM